MCDRHASLIGTALNRCVALLTTAHQVGPDGPIPDTSPPGLENLNEATNCVTPKRVSGLGVLFVATGWLQPNCWMCDQRATDPGVGKDQALALA
jgi:hypothetical protein